MMKALERGPRPDMAPVLTVGHSTRPLAEFIQLLKAHGVDKVVDVRTVPRSRHNPQFNRETLPQALAADAIGYEHVPALGGFRRPRPDTPNGGWRNPSFRGYADYMQTAEFDSALNGLIAAAGRERRGTGTGTSWVTRDE